MCRDESRPFLPDGVDLELPFFAYGLFRPGELAYPRIQEYVARTAEAEAGGRFWLRDGLLLLELEDIDEVAVPGHLLHFIAGESRVAYEAIGEFEPRSLYRWNTIEARTEGCASRANVLVGKSVQSGSEPWHSHWSSAEDPLFNEALDEVECVTEEQPPAYSNELRPFFRQQMAYLLLWSSIERYASLRWSLGTNAARKVERLAYEPSFQEALCKYITEERRIRRADDPAQSIRLSSANPRKAVQYYYQVRSNMVHRGKGGARGGTRRDQYIVRASLSELLAIFDHVLYATLPEKSRRARRRGQWPRPGGRRGR